MPFDNLSEPFYSDFFVLVLKSLDSIPPKRHNRTEKHPLKEFYRNP